MLCREVSVAVDEQTMDMWLPAEGLPWHHVLQPSLLLDVLTIGLMRLITDSSTHISLLCLFICFTLV